jgi:hypothetical protein
MSQLLGNTNIMCSISLSILFNRIERVFFIRNFFNSCLNLLILCATFLIPIGKELNNVIPEW